MRAGRGQVDMAHVLAAHLVWTSTPHFSQITPRCFRRLYLAAQAPRSPLIGPKILAQNRPSRLGLERAVVDGRLFSPTKDQERIFKARPGRS